MAPRFSRVLMPLFVAIVAAYAPIASACAQASDVACRAPWLYFDLGMTLIDSSGDHGMHYLPDAETYLRELKKRGYRLGLIINIPEKWGKNYAEKLTRLKSEVGKGWQGGRGFDWPFFEKTWIPLSDRERKPGPVLFRRARNASSPCPVIFQSEDPREIEAARKAGMRTYQVGVPGRGFYLPLEEIAVPKR